MVDFLVDFYFIVGLFNAKFNSTFTVFNYTGYLKIKMLTFLWEFLYDIIILKSSAVHHPNQQICKIFLRGSLHYQFYFSYKDTHIEILTFFSSPVGDDKNGKHVENFEIIL